MGESTPRVCGSDGSELVMRTTRAIAALAEEGKRVSFYSVAQRGEIARSTLYRRDDLRALVMGARQRHNSASCVLAVPEESRADNSEAMLRSALAERDVLIQALNIVCGSDDPVPCHFALVSLAGAAA